ncbi:MAG: fructose-1,6-bisphosphatase [Chloroflexi bacterium]|nr:fructose-1,6-bisphosphatase [Chloroflexota bacterium]
MSTTRSLYETLADFAVSTWGNNKDYDGLDAVIMALAEGARLVQSKVEAAALAGVLGSTGDINVQGEVVQILDTFASDAFVSVLKGSGRVAAIGCEEIEGTVVLGDGAGQDYIVQMDPLDGSSNIDVAISIGSIFGIWKRDPGEAIGDASLLRPGREQVAAVYTVYGSSTMMVLATRDGVQGFTLNRPEKMFQLTHPDIRIPDEVSCYSTNEGNFNTLDGATQMAVLALRESYSLRYVGSLVADFHRNLLKGGIFMYPGNPGSPEGKLRLMYESNPLAFVAEQAGGAASSGEQRILDIQPERPHQRTPLIIGNRDAVEQTVAIMKGG